MAQKPAVFVLGSPLPGFIYPQSTVHLPDFRETRTLKQHQAAGQGNGCDFGNTKTGAPVYAMVAGKLEQLYIQDAGRHGVLDQLGDGSLIARIFQANGDNQGYAHFLRFAPGLKRGQQIARGQYLGAVGTSGAPGQPHLHCHHQDGRLRSYEVYGLLEQNHSIQFNAGTNGVNIRRAPGLAAPIWAVARADGIYAVPAQRVAGHDDPLTPRPAAQVAKDGYLWLPRRLAGQDVWVARNFVHFV